MRNIIHHLQNSSPDVQLLRPQKSSFSEDSLPQLTQSGTLQFLHVNGSKFSQALIDKCSSFAQTKLAHLDSCLGTLLM